MLLPERISLAEYAMSALEPGKHRQRMAHPRRNEYSNSLDLSMKPYSTMHDTSARAANRRLCAHIALIYLSYLDILRQCDEAGNLLQKRSNAALTWRRVCSNVPLLSIISSTRANLGESGGCACTRARASSVLRWFLAMRRSNSCSSEQMTNHLLWHNAP